MVQSRKPDDRRSLKFIGGTLGALIVLGAILTSLWVYRDVWRHPRTDDAYVRANTIGVAAHVSGPIVELPIVDNQRVEEGELLFVVDPRPYEAALEEAQAQLQLTDLEIQGYEHAIKAAEAELEQRRADAAYAQQYLERVLPLLEDQFVTPDQVDEARTRAASTQALVSHARFELGRARNLLGQLGDINSRRRAAEAAVYNAKLNVNYCYVRAPFAGYVTNLNIAVGEYANVGAQVFALVDDRIWYVMANFKETYLDSIAPGMEAEVYLLSYPNRKFRGVVQGIGWALYQQNGATVGVLPNVEPTLNWVRLAQRFPVRIVLEERDPEYPFRMGATAVVTIRDSAGIRDGKGNRGLGD